MKTTAKDFFLHLGSVVTLYVGVTALLNLMFRIINVTFPQIDRYYYPISPSISLPVATLIVVFPLFLFLMNLINKSYVADPAKRDLGVKRWLTYITLFVSGAIVAGDLVTLIYYFLDGRELTSGFILKIVAVLVVSGGVFGYYVDDLKGRLTGGRRNMWRLISAVLVLGSIIAGFYVIGSPRTQRQLNYDQRKVADLQNIQSQVISYWQSKQALPQNLDELNDPLSYELIPSDPQSGKSYEYKKLSGLSFELCANFNLESVSSNIKPRVSNAMYYVGMENENWQHNAGRFCFERTVDPDRYPPFNKR